MRQIQAEQLRVHCIATPCVITLLADIDNAILAASARDKAELAWKTAARYLSIEIQNHRGCVESGGMST